MNRRKSILFITGLISLTAFCLLTNACKKEHAETITIEIAEPVSGYSGSFGDSITVRAIIQSEAIIQTVSIALVDADQLTVNTPLLVHPSSNKVELFETIAADNELSPSGNYYVEVRATTKNASAIGKVSIYLQGIPKKLDAVYVLSRSDSFSFTISKIDSGQLAFEKTVSGDYSGSAISSIHHCLYTAGVATGPVHCFDLEDFQENFTIQPPNPLPLTSFTTLSFSNELCFIGYRNGAIRGFDSFGRRQYDTNDDPYFIPQHITRSGDYVLAELFPAAAGQKHLAAYFYPSGVRRQLLQIDFDVQGIAPVTADESLLFTIRNNKIEIYNYSVAGNYVDLVKQGSTMELHGVLEFRPGEYLLAATQGLYHYRKNVNSLLQVDARPSQSVEYDDVHNLLYCASGSVVRILSANDFHELNVINSPDSILAVRILYNK